MYNIKLRGRERSRERAGNASWGKARKVVLGIARSEISHNHVYHFLSLSSLGITPSLIVTLQVDEGQHRYSYSGAIATLTYLWLVIPYLRLLYAYKWSRPMILLFTKSNNLNRAITDKQILGLRKDLELLRHKQARLRI